MEDLYNFIDDLLDSILLQADEQHEIILARIIDYVKNFDVENGVIKNNDTTARAIIEIKKAIEGILNSSEIAGISEEIIGSFLDTEKNSISLTQSLSNFQVSNNFIKNTLNPARILFESNVRNQLAKTSLSSSITFPIIKRLVEAVEFGYTIKDTTALLENDLKFRQYLSQIAHDSFFQFDGEVQSLLANRYNLNAMRYVGSVVRDSRGQCRKWVGKTLTLEEWKKEITWAKRGGSYSGHKISGFIKGTNISNFAIYRGGYKCRHRAIAVNK